MFVMWGKQNQTSLIHVNISFLASEKPLNRNEIPLKLLQTAVKFEKYRWKIAPNEISPIIYLQISPIYIYITFVQYCI